MNKRIILPFPKSIKANQPLKAYKKYNAAKIFS
jgi:hypothetical protein